MYVEGYVTMIGAGSPSGAEPEKATDYPAAILWVPDPEQRSGWREYYVYPPKPKSGIRPLGFGARR